MLIHTQGPSGAASGHAPRDARLAAVTQLGRIIASSFDLTAVLESVAQAALDLLEVQKVVVWLLDADGQRFIMGARVVAAGFEQASLDTSASLPRHGTLLGQLLDEGRAFQTTAIADHPRWRARRHVAELGLTSYLGAPLLAGGRGLGAISALATGRRRFDAADVELLTTFANLAALAIENTRLYRRVSRLSERLLGLQRVAARFASEATLDALLDAIMDEAQRAMGGQSGNVFEWDEAAQVLHSLRVTVPGTPPYTAVLGLGVAGRAAQQRTVVIINDYQREVGGETPAGRAGSRAAIGAPMLLEGRFLGAIAINSHDPTHKFDDEDAQILELLAIQAAAALHRTRIEEQARRQEAAAEALRELDRLKTEFLATVSHELRTPLTYIHGYAELLLHRDLEREQVQDMAGQIFAGSTTMKRMVDDLLDLSRLEAGGFSLSAGPVELGNVLASVVAAFQARTTRHELVLRAPADLPHVLADPDRLRQVLSVLLTNAIHYSPDGGPIEVRAEAAREGVAITVEDRGIGISESALPRIFERFYRGEQAVMAGTRGAGLGLSVAKQLVKAQGGTIGVTSRVGRGSSFTIWFPLARTE